MEATVLWLNYPVEHPIWFEVPNEFIPAMLRCIDPPTPVESSVSGEEVAALHITCSDDRVVDMHFIFYGKNPAIFTINGVQCVRGGPYKPHDSGGDKYMSESGGIGEALLLLQRKEFAKANERIDDLDVSAGRKPPKLETK
jgi:hypothetical protein